MTDIKSVRIVAELQFGRGTAQQYHSHRAPDGIRAFSVWRSGEHLAHPSLSVHPQLLSRSMAQTL